MAQMGLFILTKDALYLLSYTSIFSLSTVLGPPSLFSGKSILALLRQSACAAQGLAF